MTLVLIKAADRNVDRGLLSTMGAFESCAGTRLGRRVGRVCSGTNIRFIAVDYTQDTDVSPRSSTQQPQLLSVFVSPRPYVFACCSLTIDLSCPAWIRTTHDISPHGQD